MGKANLSLADEWDVIIVGTGMGGATAGYSLTQKGISVLFLEKGGNINKNIDDGGDSTNPTERLNSGWWPEPISQLKNNGRYEQLYASIGCGYGGSTMHYAAALERLDEADFDAIDKKNTHCDRWPIAYKDFEQYYDEAEELYGVKGVTKPKLSDWDKAFVRVMKKNGFNPERLNVGIKYDEDCQECIGKVCHRKCKADSKTICLEVALEQPSCKILEYCDVIKLDADESKVNYVLASYNGNQIRLKAKIYILSAGAMHSPQLLLKSKNNLWPNGLSNNSDQVGRNLMFHIGDLYAVWSTKKLSKAGVQKKAISIRDFYVHNGEQLGHIQNLGLNAGRGHISIYLKNFLRRYGIKNNFILSALTKIPSTLASRFLGEAKLFGVNVEDYPDPNNRIRLDDSQPDGAHFTYTITNDVRYRANKLLRLFSKAVSPWIAIRVTPSLHINNGHACGTCRFGTDPTKSVLNKVCRSHDVLNLYVVDSSFMPRSGAANPSLTIAANALRVAENIAESLSKQ